MITQQHLDSVLGLNTPCSVIIQSEHSTVQWPYCILKDPSKYTLPIFSLSNILQDSPTSSFCFCDGTVWFPCSPAGRSFLVHGLLFPRSSLQGTELGSLPFHSWTFVLCHLVGLSNSGQLSKLIFLFRCFA